MAEQDFDTLFGRRLQEYAEGGVRRIDPVSIAEATIQTGTDARRGWSLAALRRSLQPLLVALLTTGAVAGLVIAGAWLLRTPSVVPSPEPSTSPAATGAPVVAPPTTPCAAMLRILGSWQIGEGGLPADALGSAGDRGTLVMTALSPKGVVQIAAIDPEPSPPAPMAADALAAAPYLAGFPLSSQGRIVVSPDGRAMAAEEGDPGQAGCGEPIILTAGGLRRPFPTGGFERVSDLAWAPDSSALYGVRRPTIDGAGQPYFDPNTGEVLDGPGSLERWDARTGEVTVLGAGCGTCGALFLSPDGDRIATTDGDRIVVREPDGTWRPIFTKEGPLGWNGFGLLGWADDRSVVWADGSQGGRIALDGTSLVTWPRPPAHTWTVGPLAPDGSTIAGMTLSDDMLTRQVVLLDVADGSSRVVWPAPGADPADAVSGSSRIVAWSPDGRSVVLLDQAVDSTDAILRIVATDGSGATAPLTVQVPDLSSELGFPNIGPAVAWLPPPEP